MLFEPTGLKVRNASVYLLIYLRIIEWTGLKNPANISSRLQLLSHLRRRLWKIYRRHDPQKLEGHLECVKRSRYMLRFDIRNSLWL